MPLRAEVRALYGAEWRRFREQYAKKHPPVCAECSRLRDEGRLTNAFGLPGLVTHWKMNLCHLTHDPHRRDRLAWLCPRHHALHDNSQRIAMWRRGEAQRAGQLWLLPEVEFAPFALWEIPEDAIEAVLEALQEQLFP
jgi:hypothetical protein